MKILKYLFYFVAFIAIIFMGFYLVHNEKLPVGTNPAKADSLANKMMAKLNKPAWDSTAIIQWSFKDVHDFVWDKKNGLVQVKWDKNEVLLNLNDWPKGKAFIDGKAITDAQLDVLRGKAYSYFCNDSFWMIAPFKAMDEGVSRKIVLSKEGNQNLLVSYASGGVTPGDSYLWILDENAQPIGFKMWVKIIPIGGVYATWSKWIQSKTGVSLATDHQLGPLNLGMTNVATGQNLADLNLKIDLFKAIQ
jgi:hypothetical protein